MNDNNKKVFDFIVKCYESRDTNLWCDYYELRDNVKISEEELSKAIKELKKEGKIIAKEGEYLPILKEKEK